MDDAWEEDDGEEPTWEDVLPTRGRKPRREGGPSAVAGRLADPPLSAINGIVKNHVPYTAVPQAAAPRRDRGDRPLHNLKRSISNSHRAGSCHVEEYLGGRRRHKNEEPCREPEIQA